MNGWKWTTTAGLVVALAISCFALWGAYAAAEEAGGYFTINETGFFLSLVLWWSLVKFALDAAVWVRGKFR